MKLSPTKCIQVQPSKPSARKCTQVQPSDTKSIKVQSSAIKCIKGNKFKFKFNQVQPPRNQSNHLATIKPTPGNHLEIT